MAATLIGNVESISGNVTVVHSDGSSEILQNNSLLYLHDVLAADGQSHAQVRLINNSLLDLHAGETLVLESDYLTVTGFENTVAGSDAAVAVSAIGVVTRVEGTVEVMRDGKVIALHPGDFVYTGDVLQTATDASTTFTMLDGSKLEFGPDSRATLNDDLFSSRYADFLGAGVDDPAAIQAAILAGQDPSRDAPAPGAGQATGNEGHTFIQIDASGRAVTPESGHETHGQTLPFNQTQEELLQNLYPDVSIGDGVPDPAVEGTDGSITFTVSLTNASAVPVTVAYQTVDGSAVAGSDYTGQSGTLTFAAGQTSQTITVAVLDDQVFEDPESFQVVISNADASGTALVISDATGVGSIRDTDAPTIFAVYNNNGIVDEKGLPEGSGELLDGNALNNSDASETTGGYFTIDAGANGPDKFEVMDSNGNWIEVTSGGTISGVNGTLTINENNGAYTWSYTLETNLLTHNDTSTTDGDSDRGAADQVMGEAFQIRVMDSEGDVSVPKTLDITVNDDGPSDFNPTPVILVNSGDGSGSGPLDMFAHMGADGLGSVVFTGGNDGDLLTGLLNGNTVAEPIMYKNETIALTGYGTGTLTGISSVTDTQILKIELNPDTADESADQYTITFFTDINDGSGFVFDDFSSAPAGQNKWIGLDRDGLDINNPTDPEPDSVDLLITAFSGNSIATINTSSKDIGVDNQWMDGDQGIRIDFVTDVRRDTAAGENEKDAQGFLYDTHSASNNLSFEVMQVQGGGTAAIRVLAYDFTGVEGDTDVNNPLKNTAVPIIAGSLLVNGVAASTLAGVTVTVDGNSIVIDGLSQGDNVYFEAVSDFESIQLSNADGQPDGQGGSYIGDPFAVGSFGFDTVIEGDQVAIAFDLLATDADGDVSNGTLDIIISPDGHVAVGTDADEVLIGDSHVDFLVGGGGDDILIGNDENDTMTGGTGADVFIWTAGQSGTDLITDFNIVEGDVLDIADLLTGVQNPTATDLEGYMSIASGSDTTITIFGDNGAADQIIQLNGYDTSNMTGAEIIENLLGSGNLLAG